MITADAGGDHPDEQRGSLGSDELDRLSAVTQKLASAPGGVAITRYSYDVMDNLVSVTDPNGNVTSYAYDDFRRLAKQVSPVTGTTLYTYDAAGLLSTTDARGLRIRTTTQHRETTARDGSRR